MDGFEKINLAKDTPASPTSDAHVISAKKRGPGKKTKILMGVIGVFAVLTTAIVFGIVIPGMQLVSQARATYVQARVLYDALKQQNVDLMSQELAKTKSSLATTTSQIASMGYLAYVPGIHLYYNDAINGAQAATHALNAGEIALNAVKPYADVLGLKGAGTFAGGSAQDRIRTTITTMDKITPQVDAIADELRKAEEYLSKVNENNYPSFIMNGQLQGQIAQAKTLTSGVVTFVDEARPLVKKLPVLLGSNKDTKYLILFQNDKELRPTGGFLTAYTIVRLEKGVIKLETSEDIYALDATVPAKPRAPRPILAYLPNVTIWNLRDTNLSPDFKVSMDTFYDMYERSSKAKDIQGIIAIDTDPLVAAINVLGGEITVNGVKYTTKNDPRCDCPQVIYELEDYASRPVGYIRENRKGLIGDMMFAIFDKTIQSPPRQVWGPMIQAFADQANRKHVLFYLFDEEAQKGIEALNLGGRIRAFDGDYLHINDSNMGGQKSNLFITQSVAADYAIDGDGTVKKTVTITYRNPFAPSDCNLERGNLCLNAPSRTWLRLYVPQGSVLGDMKGSEITPLVYDELGKTVFEGFMSVRPQGTATVTVTYTIPQKVTQGTLPVLIQKQPGTDQPEYTISVNGKAIQNFPLISDTEFTVSR